MSTINFEKMHGDLVAVVTVGIDLGWTARDLGRPGVHLMSHDGRRTMTVPRSRQVNHNRLNHMRNTIIRYAEPGKRRSLALAKEAVYNDPEILDSNEALDALTALALPESISLVRTGKVEGAQARRYTRPYHARKGDGSLYESKAVLEVVEDGVVVGYQCSKCDYEASTVASVAVHHGRSKNHQEVGPQAPIVAKQAYEPEHRDGYNPSDRLVRMLSHFLAEAVAGGGEPDWTEIARSALTWMHTRPDMPSPEDRVREPLTDTEILDRIRTLCLGDEAIRLRETNDKLVAELAQAQQDAIEGVNAARIAAETVVQEVAQDADEKVRQAEARVDRMRAEWNALRDLVSREETDE